MISLIQLILEQKITYSKDVGDLLIDGQNIRDNFAIRLTKLGKFHGTDELANLVPERKTHIFALHPRAWKWTFGSLTLKDPRKIIFYGPTLIPIKSGTLIADMAFYNRFERGDKEAASLYVNSLKLLASANLSEYKLPELLIPTI